MMTVTKTQEIPTATPDEVAVLRREVLELNKHLWLLLRVDEYAGPIQDGEPDRPLGVRSVDILTDCAKNVMQHLQRIRGDILNRRSPPVAPEAVGIGRGQLNSVIYN